MLVLAYRTSLDLHLHLGEGQWGTRGLQRGPVTREKKLVGHMFKYGYFAIEELNKNFVWGRGNGADL